MANEIKDKFSSPSVEISISLAALASSTVGVGRQGDIVDNTITRYQRLLVWAFLKQGTSPTGNRKADMYLIRDDNNSNRDDGAGTSDNAITILNAPHVSTGINKSSPSTGDVIYIPSTLIIHPGPKWTLAIVHNTGVNLDASEANSKIFWIGLNPEVQ